MPKCKKCNVEMRHGKAIAQTVSGYPDFSGDKSAVTLSPSGPGVLIDCLKCSLCGWSVIPPPRHLTQYPLQKETPLANNN
jgi:hypothetical protein